MVLKSIHLLQDTDLLGTVQINAFSKPGRPFKSFESAFSPLKVHSERAKQTVIQSNLASLPVSTDLGFLQLKSI